MGAHLGSTCPCNQADRRTGSCSCQGVHCCCSSCDRGSWALLGTAERWHRRQGLWHGQGPRGSRGDRGDSPQSPPLWSQDLKQPERPAVQREHQGPCL